MKTARASVGRWGIGFGLVLAALLAFLLLADSPGEVAQAVEKRLAAGKKAPPEADFAVALWWAALGHLIVTALLALGMPLWRRGLPAVGEGGFSPARVLPTRIWVLALLAAMALAGAMRWNLAHRSLWWDELWPAKFSVVGYYLGDPSLSMSERRFSDGSWQRALWHYTRPTNHPAASLPARLSHVAWRTVARPEAPHEFSDFALRFPNWLASLLAVGAVGWLGWLWGRPLAGLLGALLLAVHPWHIRYGIDLRGYSAMILLTATGLVWLTLIFRRGQSGWWPWWALGINQGLLVWAFPHAVVVAGTGFVVAAGLIFRLWPEKGDRWTALGRLFLVHVAAAMLFLQLFAPNLLQMTRWLGEVNAAHQDHGLNAARALDLASWLATGTTWELPAVPEAARLADLASRGASGAMMALLALAFVLGGLGLWSVGRERERSGPAVWLLLVPLAAGAGLLAIFAVTQSFFYPRFLTFLLIPGVLAIGLACDWRGAGRWRVGLAALALAGAAWLMAPQWRVLMGRPYAPMRDVAEVFAAEPGPAIFACYGHGGEMLPGYVPELRSPASFEELQAVVAEARERGVGLLVAYGYSQLNRAGIPEGFTWLDDPERFELVATRAGIEPEFYFRVLRWKGGK